MTTYRFSPTRLSIEICLFDAAFYDSPPIAETIGAHFGSDRGGDPAEFAVIIIQAVLFDLANALGRQVGPDILINRFKPAHLRLFQGSPGISVLATATLAFKKIADELFLYKQVADQDIIDYYQNAAVYLITNIPF